MAFVPEPDTFVPNFGLPFWEWKDKAVATALPLPNGLRQKQRC
jgi:hypothetical protein